jgi:hypothetical protein
LVRQAFPSMASLRKARPGAFREADLQSWRRGAGTAWAR